MVFIAFKGTTHVVPESPNICEDPCWYSINWEKAIQAKVEAD